mmetsp:Transcript_17442/g.55602  ORF Transcript_17442/g.55602 Transcript_17442/m.55602 type:complete len:93 (+) Transcript_17442:162-440(+)
MFLPRPCAKNFKGRGPGAEMFSGVEYKWIFHHQPELQIFKNGGSAPFKVVKLAPMDEAQLNELWSTYFPKAAQRRLSVVDAAAPLPDRQAGA